MDYYGYVLDTNFVIYSLKALPVATRFFRKTNRHGKFDYWVSDITRIELLSFSSLRDADERRINDFLESISIHPVNEEIGNIAITFRWATRRKLPDSLIAATAIHLGMPLVTSDEQMLGTSFPGLTVIQP